MLSQSQCIAHFYLIIRLELVHLIQILQTDVIQLGYAVHRLSLAHVVESSLVALRCTLCLFLQIDDFARDEFVALVALVVFCEFLV